MIILFIFCIAAHCNISGFERLDDDVECGQEMRRVLQLTNVEANIPEKYYTDTSFQEMVFAIREGESAAVEEKYAYFVRELHNEEKNAVHVYFKTFAREEYITLLMTRKLQKVKRILTFWQGWGMASAALLNVGSIFFIHAFDGASDYQKAVITSFGCVGFFVSAASAWYAWSNNGNKIQKNYQIYDFLIKYQV